MIHFFDNDLRLTIKDCQNSNENDTQHHQSIEAEERQSYIKIIMNSGGYACGLKK